MKTLVISPTYNERKNIKLLVNMVLGDSPDFDLLIVDDNSPDGTSEKVKELQSQFKNLHLETREKKSGLGTAYIYGFKWALKNNYDRIVQMDADLSHNPKDLPMMVGRLEKYDLVIGSRYKTGINVVNWPLSRLVLSYFANIYSKTIDKNQNKLLDKNIPKPMLSSVNTDALNKKVPGTMKESISKIDYKKNDYVPEISSKRRLNNILYNNVVNRVRIINPTSNVDNLFND